MNRIFYSVEFWAALFGAVAAFMLEAMRRFWMDRRHDLAAGNEGVFSLAQMGTLARLIYNQSFIDRDATIREFQNREAFYFEYLPMTLPWNITVKLPFERLGFILRSYDPDLLNWLAAAERDFASLIQTLSERNTQQLEFQRRHAAIPKAQAPVSTAVFEKMIGTDLVDQLKHSTEMLKVGLPRCEENALRLGQRLTQTLSYQFPLGRIANFSPIERTSMNDTSHIPSPRLWRRFVRGCVTRIRKPTGIVLKKD
jgi:hypothetical protein